MSQPHYPEQIFLDILREDSNRDEINQKIHYFNKNNWQTLTDFSIKNGLFPAFYIRLSRLNLENIPSEFLSKLKNLYIFNLKTNIILERDLFKILSIFRESNIAVIPLKGPFLARYLYQDLALRQTSCDLDLLVPQEKLQDAEDILQTIGYYTDDKRRTGYHKFCREIPFFKKNSELQNFYIDLHWDIRDRFIRTHNSDFWLNAKEINIDGYPILVPSCEDLLLYIALISIYDYSFVQIKYLYDLHRLISRFGEKINWQFCLKKAKQFSLDAALFFALKLSQDFFHTDLPKGLLNAIKPDFIKENLLKLWINKTNVLRFGTKFASSFTWHNFVSRYLFSADFFDCIRMICQKIFKPMEEVMWIYNQPLSKVSYSLYIKRLLKPISNL